jgi:hypothetical protein
MLHLNSREARRAGARAHAARLDGVARRAAAHRHEVTALGRRRLLQVTRGLHGFGRTEKR